MRYETGESLGANVAGETIGWNGGVFSAFPEIIRTIRGLESVGATVEIGGELIPVGTETVEGAFAGILSLDPGRTIFTSLPQHLAALVGEEYAHRVFEDDLYPSEPDDSPGAND